MCLPPSTVVLAPTEPLDATEVRLVWTDSEALEGRTYRVDRAAACTVFVEDRSMGEYLAVSAV
jgi:hypothetical protein